MTLTKKTLIQHIADTCFPLEEYGTVDTKQISLEQGTRAVEAILSSLHTLLAAGEEIRLVGFGTFGVQAYPERQGRNPKTGLPITIQASRRIRFRPGKFLKDAVSGEETQTPPAKSSPPKGKGQAKPQAPVAQKK